MEPAANKTQVDAFCANRQAFLEYVLVPARLGHEFVFVFFGLSLCSCVFCFALVSWVISFHVLALA